MRRVIGGVMLFHYLWAQNLVMDNENQGFSEQNNPTGKYQKWFAPVEQNGQTYRRNQITIRTDFDGLALGGYSEYYWVNVEDNRVLVEGEVSNAFGGYSKNGAVIANLVEIEGVSNNAIGGYTESKASAYDNGVDIYGKVFGAVSGGYSKNGLARANSIYIANGGEATEVYGGVGMSADENEIYIENGAKILRNSYVGYGVRGDSLNNLGIFYGDVEGDIYSGYTKQGDVSYNIVEVYGNAKNVYGGKSEEGRASENSVLIEGIITGEVKGGESTLGANSNFINIHKNAKVEGNIYGGHSTTENADRNFVTIQEGAEINSNNIYGGYGERLAIGNQINLKGVVFGGVQNNIVGGYAKSGANNNDITLENINGNLSVIGGESESGHSNYNLVMIKDSQGIEEAIGGKGNESLHNTVVLYGNTGANNVYGGYGANAKYNLVMLEDEAVINGSVYGGFDGSGGIDEGNSIFVSGNIQVKERLAGFDTLYLHAKEQNLNKHILIIGEYEQNNVGDSLDLKGKKLVISAQNVKVGDDIKLIWASSGIEVDENTQIRGNETFVFDTWTPQKEEIFSHELKLEDLPHARQISPESKSLTQAFAGSLAFIRESQERMSDGVNYYKERAKEGETQVFLNVGGGYSHYNNLDIKTHGFHMQLNALKNYQNTFWVNLFFENGYGQSKTDLANIVGKVGHSYVGGGLAFLYDFESGFYSKAVAKGGVIKTDFDYFYNQTEDKVDFKSSVPYGSLSLGGGYLVNLSENFKLDIGIGYHFGYVDGDEVGLSNNSMDHLTIQNNYAHSFNVDSVVRYGRDNFNTAIGISWEKLLNNEIKSAVNGYDLESLSLEGDYLALLFSMGFQPTLKIPLSIDFKWKGYVLDRKGISADVSINYKF